MNAESYLRGMKEGIIHNIVSENNLPLIVAEEIYDFMLELLLELHPIRHLKNLSMAKVYLIDKQPEYKKLLIEDWLTKALENDDTFVYAYNVLARRINLSQGIVCFSLKKEDHLMLINLIEDEETSAVQGKGSQERYRDYDSEKIKGLYDHCIDKIMECQKEDFYCAIETADFSAIKIKTKYQFKYLISLLSSSINQEWRNDAAESLGLTPQELTKDNSKAEASLWGRQLKRILQ